MSSEENLYSYQVSTEWLTQRQVAQELGMSEHRVGEWVLRKDDPLPCHLICGNHRNGRIYRPELNEWLLRNSKIKRGNLGKGTAVAVPDGWKPAEAV